jgi:amidase
VFQAAEDTNGRDADCAELRAQTTPPVQAAIDQLLADRDLDAIVAVTNGPAWPTTPVPVRPGGKVGGDLNGHFELFVGSSTASAVSGYGSITVPAAYTSGLPIGISFIGGRWSEPELIGYAYDFEQATHVRVKPTYVPTIGDALFPGIPNPPDPEPALRSQRSPAAQHHRRPLVVRPR